MPLTSTFAGALTCATGTLLCANCFGVLPYVRISWWEDRVGAAGSELMR